MPPEILDFLSKAGALGVAIYALRQAWADKAEAVKAFVSLNEERKVLTEKAIAAVERAAVETATYKAELAQFKTQIADLVRELRDRNQSRGHDS